MAWIGERCDDRPYDQIKLNFSRYPLSAIPSMYSNKAPRALWENFTQPPHSLKGVIPASSPPPVLKWCHHIQPML